jgi:hypothetical protein
MMMLIANRRTLHLEMACARMCNMPCGEALRSHAHTADLSREAVPESRSDGKSQTRPPVQEAKMARDCHDLSKPQGGLLQATEHRASSRSVRWSWSSTKTVLLGIRDVELTGHLPLRFVTLGPFFKCSFSALSE